MAIIPSSTIFTEKLFANFTVLTWLYSFYYKKIVEREVSLASIQAKDNVLCIGGGPIPATAILIYKTTSACVTIIDKDPAAVAVAQKLINKIGMENNIYIKLACGEKLDVSPFTVVHIAAQVTPKEKVIDNTWRKIKQDARVLVRCPKERLHLFYGAKSGENSLIAVDSCAHCGCTHQQKFSALKTTLLLAKNKNNTQKRLLTT